MGSYTENLYNRRTSAPRRQEVAANAERLTAAAIVRGGVTVSNGFREHWRIRDGLGDDDPARSDPDDQEGFMTSTGRFVDRDEARVIGVASGQLSPMWERAGRKLLSSDIDW